MQNEIAHDKALEFLLGGKCTTTVYNDSTTNQRRFFILGFTAQNTMVAFDPIKPIAYYKVFYVQPTKIRDIKKYIGRIIPDNGYELYKFEILNKNVSEARNFNWLWKNICERTLTTDIHILHLGTCSVCGRPLTDAESLITGIGPICMKRIINRKKKNKVQ